MQAQLSELISALPAIRLLDWPKSGPSEKAASSGHTEFLRTGRIDRNRPNWDDSRKRYLTYEELAQRTGMQLERAGEKTHERLNSFHKSIQFPKLIFHRTLRGKPHLGYCHVTASKTNFAEYKDVRWAFYIANFFADIAPGDLAFEKINMRTGRMYFAVALEKDEEHKRLAVNTNIRDNGILFRTIDPKTAMKNVLMLGAKSEALRKVIRAL